MIVTVVVDNSVPPGSGKPFRAEHGLALLVEDGGSRLLFDTGQSDLVLHNLSLIGVHPSQIDAVILSHGHYDHTGGLAPFLTAAGKVMPVYCHEGVFAKRFALAAGVKRSIGLPYSPEQLAALGAEFRFVRSPQRLTDNLLLSGSVPRVTEYEVGDQHHYCGSVDCEACDKDPVVDDMALYYKGGKGLTVISGCAHSGIVNIIDYGLTLTGSHNLFGIIGGTHLGPVVDTQKDETLNALERYSPELVAANHCTGFSIMARLNAIFGKRLMPAFVGTVIEI